MVSPILTPGIQSGDLSRTLYEAHRSLVLSVYEVFGTTPGHSVGPEAGPQRSRDDANAKRAVVIVGSMVIIIRSFYVSHKARERYNKLYGKGSLTKRRRFTRPVADLEYTHLDEHGGPPEEDN